MRANIAVNISKSCCFAVVLAVICLPVIFVLAVICLPVILSCGCSTTEEVANLVRITASDVKKLLVSNPTAAEPSKQALASALQCEYLV